MEEAENKLIEMEQEAKRKHEESIKAIEPVVSTGDPLAMFTAIRKI